MAVDEIAVLIRRLAFCFVFGLAATFATSSILVLRALPDGVEPVPGRQPSAADVDWARRHAPPYFEPFEHPHRTTYAGWGVVVDRYVEKYGTGPVEQYFFRVRSGWPLRAFEAARFGIPPPLQHPETPQEILDWLDGAPSVPARPPDSITERWAIDVGSSRSIRLGVPRLLPLRPIWSGIVIDTLILGGVPLLALALLRGLRRRARARQGRCVECGYEQGTVSASCSECGANRKQGGRASSATARAMAAGRGRPVRFLRRISIVLVLGLVTSLVVGLALAYRTRSVSPERYPYNVYPDPVSECLMRYTRIMPWEGSKHGYEWLGFAYYTVDTDEGGMLLSLAGWPYRSFEGVDVYDSTGATVSSHGAVDLGSFCRHPLPVRPRWREIVANWGLFTAPFALVLLGWPLARLTQRRWRGRCGVCGYQLTDDQGRCPECGMRRRTRRPSSDGAAAIQLAAICILTGAGVTLGLSWVLIGAQLPDGLDQNGRIHPIHECDESDSEWVRRSAPPAFDANGIREKTTDRANGVTVDYLFDQKGTAPVAAYVWRIRSGWPLPAFEAARFGTPPPLDEESLTPELIFDWMDEGPPVAPPDALVDRWGVEFRARPHSRMMPVLYPLRPVWPGVLVDSMLFGSFPFFLVVTCVRARRWYRRRRGRCVRCAYPLGEADRCPECGTEDSRRRRNADSGRLARLTP